jgi:hypothetical protein
MKDPFVQEIRKFRMEHTQQFKADLHLICEDLRLFEATLGERVVKLSPRRIQPTTHRRGAAATTPNPSM